MGRFFAITMDASLYAWSVASTFGAYHTTFYVNGQRLFVLSPVVFLGGLIMRPRVRIPPWLLALYAPPLLLTLERLVFPPGATGALALVVDRVLLAATAAVSPVIL